MRSALTPDRWVAFRYDLAKQRGLPPADTLASVVDSFVRMEGKDRRQDQPFLIGPDGLPDERINGFFSSRRMRRRSPLTWKKYAHALGLWLNFLLAVDVRWDEATQEDAEGFKEWRLTHEDNPRLVQTSTFRGDLVALRAFYRWAARDLGVYDPVAADDDFDLLPRGVRGADIMWLDPAAYRRWRDIGLLGQDRSGRVDRAWRGRNDQRNAAFCDVLYGTGLRLVEGASVIVPELPGDDPQRGYSRCELADACAKGGLGHPYWMPRWALTKTLSYLEGGRAAAVRRAQRDGLYDRLAGTRLVNGQQRGRLQIVEPTGQERLVPINALAPGARHRLFRRTRWGLEPLALWLNEDGIPRDPHGWQHTFTGANVRIAALGLDGFTASAHILRHSFALRWYAVGKLLQERRVAHLSEEESLDFREQFGDTWHLVATLLGHRNPMTAKRFYLEPFQHLDVELLLRHADEVVIGRFLSVFLSDHPQVQGDPLAEARG